MENRKEGYIEYNNKVTHVRIIKETDNYRHYVTDNGDILEDPFSTPLYDTYEECEHWMNFTSDFVPQ